MSTTKENTALGLNFTKGDRNNRNLYVGPKDPKTTLRHGVGHFTFSNTYFQYEGNYSNNKKHGEGCLVMSNGTRIEGMFSNDELTGPAQISYANGDVYQGDLVLGEKSGYGEFHGMWYNYKGNWESNCRQGEGEFIDLSDCVKITGNFNKHKPHGFCTIQAKNDNMQYAGELNMGVKSGKGDYESDKETYHGFWKNNKFHGAGEHLNKVTRLQYIGNFENGNPDIFPNEFNAKVFKMQQLEEEDPSPVKNIKQKSQVEINVQSQNVVGDCDERIGSAASIHRVDLPLDHDEINFVFDKAKISMELYVVYQGPEYPDPNPPPVDETKKKAVNKKGKSNEPEEVEIPMLKPDPARIIGESGRMIRVDLVKIIETDQLKKSPEDTTKEEDEIVVMRLDYRDDLEDARRNIDIKKKLEELQPGQTMDDVNEIVKSRKVKERLNTIPPKKKILKSQSPKNSTENLERNDSIRNLLEKNASADNSVKNPKSMQLLAKRMINTVTTQGPQTTAIFEETLEEDFDHLVVYTGEGGILTVEDLEFPDNHPEGKFFIRLTDVTENLDGQYMLPEYKIPISVGCAVEDKNKKKPGKK